MFINTEQYLVSVQDILARCRQSRRRELLTVFRVTPSVMWLTERAVVFFYCVYKASADWGVCRRQQRPAALLTSQTPNHAVCPLTSEHRGSPFFFHLRLSMRKPGLEELTHISPHSGFHRVAQVGPNQALAVSASQVLTRQVCVTTPGDIIDILSFYRALCCHGTLKLELRGPEH